jgi:hypothetical protein
MAATAAATARAKTACTTTDRTSSGRAVNRRRQVDKAATDASGHPGTARKRAEA